MPKAGYAKTITANVRVLPTFTTFNIERTCVLTAIAEVECVGKMHKVRHVANLLIWPALRKVAAEKSPMVSQELGGIECSDGYERGRIVPDVAHSRLKEEYAW